MLKQTISENNGIVDQDFPGYNESDTTLNFNEKINNSHYSKFATNILQNFKNIKSILDIGCGAGNLAYCLKNQSYNDLFIVTLDGCQKSKLSPFIDKNNHFVVRTDLPYCIKNDNEIVNFDLFLSFEHFEHIEKQNYNIFINNIKLHSNNKSILLFTVPNIEDINRKEHVTMLSKDDWIKFIESFDLHYIGTYDNIFLDYLTSYGAQDLIVLSFEVNK